MKRPPYSSTESVFGRGMVPFIFGIGLVMSLISLATGWFGFRLGLETWQTVLFTTLIFSQLALALEARSERDSLFKINFFANPSMVGAILLTILLQLLVIYLPFFQRIFSTQSLSGTELLIAFLAGLSVIIAAEIWKWVLRRRSTLSG